MPRTSPHRDRLVQTAIRLFRQQGYAATGLAQILAQSGSPRGSLYHHFPGGKAEIAAEAVRVAGAVVTGTLEGLRDRTASAEDFVRAYVELLERTVRASDYRDGCPLATTLLETTPEEGAIAEAGRDAFAAWHAVIASVYARDGLAATDAGRRARLLIAAVEGALLLVRVEGRVDALVSVAQLLGPGGPPLDP